MYRKKTIVYIGFRSVCGFKQATTGGLGRYPLQDPAVPNLLQTLYICDNKHLYNNLYHARCCSKHFTWTKSLDLDSHNNPKLFTDEKTEAQIIEICQSLPFFLPKKHSE